MDTSPMQATSLVFFADVVDAGSFAAASRSMGLDRSNVSRKIRELEQQLGSQLLRRSTRSMELTEAGAFFYERCCLV
nr:LysR family transcriptional regulator [Pseudomonas sp.]